MKLLERVAKRYCEWGIYWLKELFFNWLVWNYFYFPVAKELRRGKVAMDP